MAQLPELGDVFAIPVPGGRFGAAQVIARPDATHVEVVVLAGTWPSPPKPAQLARAKVLPDRWGGPERRIVEATLPWWTTRLGKTPPRKLEGTCQSFGGWASLGSAWWAERRAALPAAVRAADENPSMEEVQVDLGGGPVSLRADTWKLYLGHTVPLPKQGRVRWEALDVLPALSEVHYDGADEGFVELLRKRPAIWRVGYSGFTLREVDLSKTKVSTLLLNVPKRGVRLRGSPCLSELSLSGALQKLDATVANQKFPFSLTISTGDLPPPIAGLSDVTSLEVWDVKDGDARKLKAWKALRELTLRGAPGALRHTAALRHLPHLDTLVLHQLYGLDVDGFPTAGALPSLRQLVVAGLAKEDAPTLKARVQGVPKVTLSGLKPRAWVEEHLNNPFRLWADEDAKLGKGAMTAWKKASGAIGKLGAKASRAAAQRALKPLVTTLNRFDGMDTLRREEAAEAFFALAARCGVADDVAEAWFDAWRDF